MTFPAGAGGQTPPRIDQQYQAAQPVPVSPGGNPVLRVTKVIISGAGQGIYTYSSSPPAAGNLIETAGISPSTTTDGLGNAVLPGHTTYSSSGGKFFATNMSAGVLAFYTAASAAGPWSFYGEITISLTASGALGLNFSSIFGAINVPQNSGLGSILPLSLPAPATYSQLYTGDLAQAVNTLWNTLITSAVFSG